MADPIRILGPELRIDADGDGTFDTLAIFNRQSRFGSGQVLEVWQKRDDGGDSMLDISSIQTMGLKQGESGVASVTLKVAAGNTLNPGGNINVSPSDNYSDGVRNDMLTIYQDGTYELVRDAEDVRNQNKPKEKRT